MLGGTYVIYLLAADLLYSDECRGPHINARLVDVVRGLYVVPSVGFSFRRHGRF